MSRARRYEYVGNDDFLKGETALGTIRIADGEFVVQVDRFDHPWSHGWHVTPEKDWYLIRSPR